MNDKLLRVLCLEDNSIDCQLIKAILAEQNLILQIQHAKTGSDFQDKLKRTKFDVILSDFTLPGYSGMAALQKAKEIQLETPFIFVSGTIGEERAVEGLKSGATDYVLKDNLERLGPAVRRAIAETQEHQSRKHAEDALRESEARFRQVAENIEEVFSLVDLASNKILHVSPAYEKIWKCSCDSLHQNPHNWFEAIYPEDKERVTRAAALNRTKGAYNETYRITRPDGSIRWIHDRAYPKE